MSIHTLTDAMPGRRAIFDLVLTMRRLQRDILTMRRGKADPSRIAATLRPMRAIARELRQRGRVQVIRAARLYPRREPSPAAVLTISPLGLGMPGVTRFRSA